MGASFRVLRRQRQPSTSVRSRRSSAQSAKSGQLGAEGRRAIRRVRERIRAREINATVGLTPLEAGLMRELELINRAHADYEVRGLRRSSERGGDESRHPSPMTVEGARRTATGGNGEISVTLHQSALDLGPLTTKDLELGGMGGLDPPTTKALELGGISK